MICKFSENGFKQVLLLADNYFFATFTSRNIETSSTSIQSVPKYLYPK